MRIGGQAAPVLDRLGVARRSRQDRLWRGSLSAGTARPADRLVARDKRREYRAGDLQPAFLILPVPRLTSFAPRMACELVAEDWRANYVEFAQAEHSRKTFRVAVPPPTSIQRTNKRSVEYDVTGFDMRDMLFHLHMQRRELVERN